jgi:hypothetical protein
MRKTFKEYYQFTNDEFKQLWKDCIFVFDTNALLNMYRYSRNTVKVYINLLQELKRQNRIWIPWQVGYEFHENRMEVICQYEKSYDEILKIIDNAKEDIRSRYKDHPFLDLSEIKVDMDNGLKTVEEKIKKQKENHPKWIEQDDVLTKLNEIFVDNVGAGYEEATLEKIKKDGKIRYDNSIPPGYKDKSKPEDKRYGDLILWLQVIDKAKAIQKPIIFISGDVKEDWWLEKQGKRIMPLPLLKKEMLIKAGVDFHIYTADRFLEYAKEIIKDTTVDMDTIKEVRKVRELEEQKNKLNAEAHDASLHLPTLLRAKALRLVIIYGRTKSIIKFLMSVETNENCLDELKEYYDVIDTIIRSWQNNKASHAAVRRLYTQCGEISLFLERLSQRPSISSEMARELIDGAKKLKLYHNLFNR